MACVAGKQLQQDVGNAECGKQRVKEGIKASAGNALPQESVPVLTGMERKALILYNFVRYSREITVPNSHWQRVLVFSQINIGFESRFNSLVEFSSQISQPLCYFKFSYYFSVLRKINE